MASVNKVILIGNAGRDPELRHAASGSAVCNLTLATSRQWKSKESGEKVEETEWHRVVFYDRLAEVVGEYVKKGKPVYVEGRLKTRKWQDKDGVDRYTTEVVAESMQLLGGREGGEAPAPAPRPQRTAAPAPAAPSGNGGGWDDIESDIPFANPYAGTACYVV